MADLANKELSFLIKRISRFNVKTGDPHDDAHAYKAIQLAAERLAAMPDAGAIDIINGLLDYAWRQTCTHEETHRGGFLWEICDSCGCKWADDEGGRPEFETPKAIMDAEVYLAKIRDSEK